MKRWLIVLALLLSACGADNTVTPVPTTAPSNDTATAPVEATEQPSSGSSEPVVIATLARSGGIAGKTTTVEIWSDGRVFADQGIGGEIPSGQIPEPQVQQIQDLVNSAEFQQLDEQYMPDNGCCDRYTYTLNAAGKTITTMDGVDWPQPLAQALDMLQAVLAQLPTVERQK